MKKLRTMLVSVITLSVMLISMTAAVSADTTTDLESMTVYAVNASGEKTEVSMNFSSTTYTYDLTVMSDIVEIEIEAAPADNTSTWEIEKDGINTKMDFGKNLTIVNVKSSSGVVNKYTLNTTKLTEDEQATYTAPENNSSGNDAQTTKKDKDTTVKVGKTEMKIASSFSKSEIPEGFKKDTAEYDGKKYACIKGEVKELTAFWLYNDETEGFYIYNSESNKFYPMNNIQIKSRMYTIVNPDKTDKILKNYDKKKVTIIDKEVNAWILDEEEGMYLVYAMNWNGETSLYTYDDNEKCFQRYPVSSDIGTQMEAANKAYDNLQEKFNGLVDKYNMILKILCGLSIVIIVLIFVIINLSINKKTKEVKEGKNDKKSAKKSKEYISDEKADTSDVNKIKEESEQSEDIEEFDDIDDIDNAEDEKLSEPSEEKRKMSDRKNISDRSYGDEPTFGSDSESEEGFYGGEIEDEDEVFIDITDDKPEAVTPEEIEKNTEEAQHEAEEDIKATLKSMLPDEEDDSDDDDEDFEFIDLN